MPSTTLISLLRTPQAVGQLTGEAWNAVVLAGRQYQLLGALAALLQRSGHWVGVPQAVQRHLELELLTATRRSEAALWEVSVIRRTVAMAVDLVLLKGCAYIAAGDVNHQGRSFSDVDLMIPHSVLQRVEMELIGGGWKPSRVDAYDDGYYRNWMHEIPPMEHVRRRTVLDLHHAINPPVAAYYVNPELLRSSVVAISPGLYVLSPLDRVAHCAIHLIQEGETKKLLRDLYDLHLLLGQHCSGDDGLAALFARSQMLGVRHLVGAAVAAANQLFGQKTRELPSTWLQRCLVVGAQNAHERGSVRGNIAGLFLLTYSHWIRMPLKLLVPHLCRKSIKALFSRETDQHAVNIASNA